MTQLPSNVFAVDLWRHAYARCLDFESSSISALPPTQGPSPLVCARFLGYMIREAPADTGRDNISNDLIDCTDNEALKSLATLYIDVFLRCFKSTKGYTPVSSHPSKSSCENDQETLKYSLEVAPQDYQTAKSQALIRDGYRCVLTGTYDRASYVDIPSVRQRVDSGGFSIIGTRAAHIFPESIKEGISDMDGGGSRHEHSASVWAVMERFGQVLIAEELNGPAIYCLENVMTMHVDKHDIFNALGLWLERTATPNHYTVGAALPAYPGGIPSHVTFTSQDSTLPLPSPRYLGLHAACARVVHLSGVGEYIQTVSRDLEETLVMATDGSSSDVLNAALRSVRVR